MKEYLHNRFELPFKLFAKGCLLKITVGVVSKSCDQSIISVVLVFIARYGDYLSLLWLFKVYEFEAGHLPFS